MSGEAEQLSQALRNTGLNFKVVRMDSPEFAHLKAAMARKRAQAQEQRGSEDWKRQEGGQEEESTSRRSGGTAFEDILR